MSHKIAGKRGTGALCAKHPEGRSGKARLSPFFLRPDTGKLNSIACSSWNLPTTPVSR